MDEADGGTNLRADEYYIAAAWTVCPHCAAPTRVVSVYVGHHELLDPDSDSGEAWIEMRCPALLFHLYALGERAKKWWRKDASVAAESHATVPPETQGTAAH